MESESVGDCSLTFTSDLPEHLSVDSRLIADGGIVFAGIVGVFLFVAGWLAKKVLDDVYELKIRPSIRKALGVADDGLDGSNASKPKILMVGISYDDSRVFILIGIVGDSFTQILEQEHLIREIYEKAVQWTNDNPSDRAIHLYIVDRGETNNVPMIYNDLASVNRFISKLNRTENSS